MRKYVPVPGSSWQQFLNPKIPGESKTQNPPASPKFPGEEKNPGKWSPYFKYVVIDKVYALHIT